VDTIKRLTTVLVAVICSGCQTVSPSFVSTYASDPLVQDNLARLEGVVLAVDEFDIESGAQAGVPCKGQPIRFSRTSTIADYIRDAIESELLTAGKYDQDAPVSLSGTIKHAELKFDGRVATGAIGATWIIDIELRSSNGQSLGVRSGRSYRTGFEVISCPEAARALMPAVQKLILTAVTQQQFALLART